MDDLKVILESYCNGTRFLVEKWSDPDVLVLLYQRELLEDRIADLSSAQLGELERADAVLARKWKIVSDFVPHPAHSDRRRWWWFLHKGPQVREEALKATAIT